jgi:hypothetical protein
LTVKDRPTGVAGRAAATAKKAVAKAKLVKEGIIKVDSISEKMG